MLSRLNMAPYFKHQETRSYVAGNDAGEAMTYRAGYRGHLRPVYWIALLFWFSDPRANFGAGCHGPK
jgi:hypothetical protein